MVSPSHAFEYHDIHDMVLKILDHALESGPPDDIDEVARKVLDDRKADIEKLWDGNPLGKVQRSPVTRTSLTSRKQMVQPIYSSQSSSTPGVINTYIGLIDTRCDIAYRHVR